MEPEFFTAPCVGGPLHDQVLPYWSTADGEFQPTSYLLEANTRGTRSWGKYIFEREVTDRFHHNDPAPHGDTWVWHRFRGSFA